MAIENLSIAHSDLEVRGGLQYVAIGLLSQASAMTFVDSDAHKLFVCSLESIGNFERPRLSCCRTRI
jgi:hypothetical protein